MNSIGTNPPRMACDQCAKTAKGEMQKNTVKPTRNNNVKKSADTARPTRNKIENQPAYTTKLIGKKFENTKRKHF